MLRYLENQCQRGLGKLGENPCLNSRTVTTTPNSGRTHTSPYDSGWWGRCWRSQSTLGDGKIISWPILAPFFNVNLMGVIKLVIIVCGRSSKCWNKPFHVIKGVNCCGFCSYYISHQVLNSWMKSSNWMVLITPENWRSFLEAPYMSSMSHTSGTYTTGRSSTLKFEESSSNVNRWNGWLELHPSLGKSFGKLVFKI